MNVQENALLQLEDVVMLCASVVGIAGQLFVDVVVHSGRQFVRRLDNVVGIVAKKLGFAVRHVVIV